MAYDIFLGQRHLATWIPPAQWEQSTREFKHNHMAWICPGCSDIWIRFLRDTPREDTWFEWSFTDSLCPACDGDYPFPEYLWYFQAEYVINSLPKEFKIWLLKINRGLTQTQEPASS